MLSPRTIRPAKAFALAVTFAALAAPTAQSNVSVQLITEHSAGQNTTGQRSTAPIPLITEHSAGQNGTPQRGVLGSAAATSVSAPASNAFKWDDAGVGAGVAFTAMLLAVGIATVILRRGRRRLAGL
ncbi:MAG: hypothetical protein E6G64_11660 [Actinobacteria bacterium]|nr:MAG: hypothetical protein E6G64_11660 [Actinomycetota bacterium]